MTGLEALVSTRVAVDVAILVLGKASAVLLFTGAAAHALRARSAAARHHAWTAGLLALLLLPVAEWVLPEWRPAFAGVPYPAESPLLGLAALETQPPVPEARSAGGAVRPPPSSGFGGIGLVGPVVTAALVVWWVGAIAAMVRVLAALSRAFALRLRSRRLHGRHPLWAVLGEERLQAGIRRAVDLRITPERDVAATMGTLRPVIVLGRSVVRLPVEQLRPVLIHELAHVRRRDFMTHVLGSLAAAIYWPNPLYRWAKRHAVLERERACDDEVLNRGVASTLYARVLLGFVTAPPALNPATRGAPGLLRLSATRKRIDSILRAGEDRCPHRPRGSAVAATALAALTIALGSLQLAASAPGTGTTRELIAALDHADPSVRARAARTLGRRDPTSARTRLEPLLDDPVADVRIAAIGVLEQSPVPASLPALARVLERPYGGGRGEHGFVLKLAMRALGHLDSGPAARLLEAQLSRPVAPLRWMALETLMSMPRHGHLATPYLKEFIRSDPSERNRRLARAALAHR